MRSDVSRASATPAGQSGRSDRKSLPSLIGPVAVGIPATLRALAKPLHSWMLFVTRALTSLGADRLTWRSERERRARSR